MQMYVIVLPMSIKEEIYSSPVGSGMNLGLENFFIFFSHFKHTNTGIFYIIGLSGISV